MLKSKLEHFYAAVDEARANVGESPAKVTDAVMQIAFPLSCDASRSEGCDDMLRNGIYKAITRYITKPAVSERQRHFNDIDPDLLPMIEPLGKSAYLVPSSRGSDVDDETKTLGFYVPVADLIHDLDALEGAYDFLREKAGHVQAEADKLGVLLAHLRATQ